MNLESLTKFVREFNQIFLLTSKEWRVNYLQWTVVSVQSLKKLTFKENAKSLWKNSCGDYAEGAVFNIDLYVKIKLLFQSQNSNQIHLIHSIKLTIFCHINIKMSIRFKYIELLRIN